ncbi:MAG TPA: hypothetical protein VGI86_21205 [Acidimicrobiia bacterium]
MTNPDTMPATEPNSVAPHSMTGGAISPISGVERHGHLLHVR